MMILQKYELARALALVRDAVSKKAIMPVMEGVLIRDGCLAGGNSELKVRVRIDGAEGESFVIPPVMMDMVKTLPDDDVEIICRDGAVLELRAGRIRQRCQGWDADDYPYYKPDPDHGDRLVLPGGQLADAISKVAFAASDKDGAGMMNGILLEADNGRLDVVALDGCVVAWAALNLKGDQGNQKMKVIIPKVAARKLASIGTTGNVEVSYDRASITFRCGDITIESRLIAGDYYAYRWLFGNAGGCHAVISRKALDGAMTRAKLCLQGNAKKPVIFSFGDGEIGLTMNSAVSEYSETLESEGDDTEIMIGLDPAYIQKALGSFNGDRVRMDFTGKTKPVVLSDEEDDGMKVMVLPVNF